MFEFIYQKTKLNLITDGCFEPNLTTKLLLSAVIKELRDKKNKTDIRKIIEIGCGCGVISSFLIHKGYMDGVQFLGMSDISDQAIHISKKNINNLNIFNNPQKIEYKVGSGLLPWKGLEFDFVINDISAISQALVPMSSWFLNAPNNAGIDGISNTLTVLNEFKKYGKKGTIMFLPILSLSNIERLFKEIQKLDLRYEEVEKQAWPLPSDMVKKYKDRLIELRELKHIDFTENFGQLIVDTYCFKIIK